MILKIRSKKYFRFIALVLCFVISFSVFKIDISANDTLPYFDEEKSLIKSTTFGVEEEKEMIIKEVKIEEIIESYKDLEWERELEYCENNGLEVPDWEDGCNSLAKTYMGYTAVTSKISGQYKLLNSSEAWSDEVTGFRMIGDRICIAMGTGYASKIGTKIDLVMENGNVVKCILGDIKSDRHTDDTHRYHLRDGSVAEMIVDYDYFEGTHQYPSTLDGRIKSVVILDETF